MSHRNPKNAMEVAGDIRVAVFYEESEALLQTDLRGFSEARGIRGGCEVTVFYEKSTNC